MNLLFLLISALALSIGACAAILVHARTQLVQKKRVTKENAAKNTMFTFASKLWRLRGLHNYQQQARYALPAFMETLAMLLSAGFPLQGALQRMLSVPNGHTDSSAARKGDVNNSANNSANTSGNTSANTSANNQALNNPLVREFREVLRRTRTGESLSEALRKLKVTLPGPEIAMFVSLLIQANQHGGRLADLLNYQADVRRQQIAEEIETHAQEAPVRLLMPLVIFIFPATMLPFIGVIIGKLMWPS